MEHVCLQLFGAGQGKVNGRDNSLGVEKAARRQKELRSEGKSRAFFPPTRSSRSRYMQCVQGMRMPALYVVGKGSCRQ